MKKKFQITLILVFEVIVQPPENTFEIGIFFRGLAQQPTIQKSGFLGTQDHL